MFYSIDASSEIPIYRQLADRIRADAISGALPYGERLPTVRELANSLHIAVGTVKRTYEELEKNGIVQMTQGRGTFVSYRREDPESRKTKAMAAIDRMFGELESLSFSQAEISIFLDLKERERAGRRQAIQVALVDCNPETVSLVAAQLRAIRSIELHSFLLNEISVQPYRLEQGIDLVVTTNLHMQEVTRMLSDPQKLEQAVLTPDPATVIELTGLPAGAKVGIVCKSSRFAAMVLRECSVYAKTGQIGTFLFGGQELAEFLSEKDALILPADWEHLCSGEERQMIHAAGVHCIRYHCGMDRGSMLHLEERLQTIQKDKMHDTIRSK